MNTSLKTVASKSLLVALIAACGFAGVVRAEEAINSVKVNFADLNLSSDKGVARLYTRLRIAAGQVCGSEPEYSQFRNHDDWAACRQTSLTRAVGQIGNPALIALHQQKTGATPAMLVADSM